MNDEGFNFIITSQPTPLITDSIPTTTLLPALPPSPNNQGNGEGGLELAGSDIVNEFDLKEKEVEWLDKARI